VHGGGLLAHVHEVERAAECRVEDRHDVVARQREHGAAVRAFEGAYNDVGATDGFAHLLGSPRAQAGTHAAIRTEGDYFAST
jgi:hypothetical protein